MRRSTQVLGRKSAERFREEHGLGTGPLVDLVGVIEEATGNDVAIVKAPTNEHGLTVTDPERGAVFVLIACSDNPMRQRSSLAHELSHVIHSDCVELSPRTDGRRPAPERLADAFARHLLIPRAAVERAMESHQGEWTEADLSLLVRRYLVSPAIAAIALSEAGAITDDTKEEWKQIYTPVLAARYGWSEYYAALQNVSRRPRPPRRLLARAIEGYRQGVVSAQTLATLRGVPVVQLVSEMESAGVRPVPDSPVWSIPSTASFPAVDLAELDVLLGDESEAET